MLDLIGRHSLVLDSCRFVVLDEADEMLDLGFLEDVEKILRLTPNSRQTALFSATMPPPIRKLADNYLYDPEHVKVQSATMTVDSVEQFQLTVKTADKADKLVEVLEAEKPDQAIVFARTKIRTDQLYKKMKDRGFNVKALHGDMSQGSRDGVMLGFKGGRVPILVATDVAARGLDISTVTHVVNFDVPRSPDVYVHRIGRTGRVGRAGRAITFVEPKQEKELEAIERHTGVKVSPWEAGATVAPSSPSWSSRSRAATPSRTSRATATRRTPSSSSPAAAPPASRSPTSSAPSPTPRRSTARRCATSRCSSTSRFSPSRPPRPSGSPPRSTASACAGAASGSSPRRSERAAARPGGRTWRTAPPGALLSQRWPNATFSASELEPCGTDPMTGFYRDGCCSTGPEDLGSHTICAVVTEEFLAHQRSIGNDLSTPMPMYRFPGLVPGDRWCVTAVNWLRAYEDGAASYVVLASTHERALEIVSLDGAARAGGRRAGRSRHARRLTHIHRR